MSTLTRRQLLAAPAVGLQRAPRRRPNVILVITDDQGYGDLGCHGNTAIHTPNLDRLHGESLRLTDFHVDPLCAPTRAALLTGRYAYRCGVTAAYAGRSILRRDETTMAERFAAAGYRTGLFGKWHLGDNYPYRPSDRGFQESVACWSGGVTQAADAWGNDYFDDTYSHNNRPRPYKSYCTDVFTSEAIRFIEEHRRAPFFLYLATNAPHAPYLVSEKYSRPYEHAGLPKQMAAFYGMITNIDENLGRLRRRVSDLGLDQDTIFVFMTDNGTAAGAPGGMRGRKASPYEGGHRVPFFLRYPAGGLGGGRDISALTAHIDVLPTLLDLARIEASPERPFDGVSLAPLLRGQPGFPAGRAHFIQHQQFRVNGNLQLEHPKPFLNSAVLAGTKRLVNGGELYDIGDDPAQANDIAQANPEEVARLRASYERWWTDVTARFGEYLEIVVGSEHESPSRLTCFDWYGGDGPPNQERIRAAPWTNGFWAIEVARAGRYRITLRQQPAAAGFPIEGETVRLRVAGTDLRQEIPPGASSVGFDVTLPAGKARLETWFLSGDRSRGAFFAEIAPHGV